MEGYGGKDLHKRKVLSLEWKSEGWWMMSGELMEPIKEVPLKGLGESELDRLVRGWQINSRNEGKHTVRNDLLNIVEKMMWMDEWVWPKMKSMCCEEAEL